ncbi:unnamed protein product [Angiostrongylus costaricensis]|uniref:HCO3_cotransp domain-containing protein n=1 Tax=Angiostrongylus costaricensis TaxID=334426 RepID=A0A0R3PSP8_ANGCS|nr:unnamed protein product [Angiostrongylus costaricensis]
MSPAQGDTNLYKQLLVDKQLTLSDFFEMKRPLLLSDSDNIKETAFSELIDLVCSFPHDFLSVQQGAILLLVVTFLLQLLSWAAGYFGHYGFVFYSWYQPFGTFIAHYTVE